MKLKQLLSFLQVREVSGEADVEISGVHADSRRIKKGDLFVALRGEKTDGHDHVGEAVSNGAAAIVCERSMGAVSSVAQIRVADTRVALASLASAFHGKPSSQMKVIGITGTNGKTTTSYLIAGILEAAGLATGVIGTVAYRIGQRELPAPNTTPIADDLQELLAKMLQAGMKAVVMEVSSHSLVQHRVDEIAWDTGVFTNLTQDHLDYHGTMEAYLEAKKILFQQLGVSGKKAAAVLNHDDARFEDFRKAVGEDVSVLSYGLQSGADVRATNVEFSIEGCRFQLEWKKESIRIATPLCGSHNVMNCLAAAASALAMGIDLRAVRQGLESVQKIPGRLERVGCDAAPFAVFVDYAHTDDALRNVLVTLRPLTQGRLITVFGCGGNRDKAKRPLMAKVVGELSDDNIVTTDNPRFEEPDAIAQDIVKGFGKKKNFEVILDRRQAIRRALEKAKAGDVVLLAGKGHETYQDVKGMKSPFDDRQIALETLEQISNRTEGAAWKN